MLEYRSPSVPFLRDSFGRRHIAIQNENHWFIEVLRQHLQHEEFERLGLFMEMAMEEFLEEPASYNIDEPNPEGHKQMLEIIDKIRSAMAERYERIDKGGQDEKTVS